MHPPESARGLVTPQLKLFHLVYVLYFIVHQGNWYGDIAIKFFDMESTEDEQTLEAFRKEVATYRNTRHENLILFMGACMNPPKLAIVTSLCKGNLLL